jgi:hypothetical protein
VNDLIISVSWRDVLDCKLPGANLIVFAKDAARLGYQFFAYHGALYVVEEDGMFYRLPLVKVPEAPTAHPLDTPPDPIE